MEKAVLNINILKVTQGMNNSFSHKGVLAIDIAGHNGFKAPFTGVVKRKYETDNEIWLESLNKVKYADGTEDYMTLLIMHDNNTSDLKVGQVIKQGQVFYQQGTKGYATGAHNHVTVGKGKFSGTGWYKNSSGQWCINNQYDITKALYVYNGVNIQNGGGYKWTKTSDFVYNPTPTNITGIITYDVFTNKWLPEVKKCDDTPNGYAGIGKESITCLKCKPQYGELKYKVAPIGSDYLPEVSSKNYSSGSSNSYAGIPNKPIDRVIIKSTTGYVLYRVKTKEDGWLAWVDSRTNTGNNSYAGIKGHAIIGIQMK